MRHHITALFFVLLGLSPAVAFGQTVTAMWDASPPSENVTSYQVCVGTSSLSCNVQLASVSNTQTSYTFSPTGGLLYYVAVRAINATGTGAYSAESVFSIPAVAQPANQSTQVGTTISPLNLSVTDPDGSPLNFTHTGLPVGLSLNSTNGQITGTPSSAGTYNVTIFVTDSLATVSRSFVWTVTSAPADTTAPALAITSQTSGQTVATSSITVSGTATDSGKGGSGIAAVTVNGQAATGGTASGNGTANWSRGVTLSPGSNAVTVQATDGAGNLNSQQITLNYSIPAVTGATLTANLASPQNTGTAITFTASASGGVAPREYKFLVQQGGGAAQVAQTWSTATTYTWTPTTAASYTVTVWARSAGVTVDAPQAQAQLAYTINTPPPAPVTSVTLGANLASPQNTGTAITFTATGSGGVAPREYKFLVQQGGGAAQVAQTWSTATTYTWTPTTAASYTVTVWARSAGVTVDAPQAQAQLAYTINTPPPASVTSVTLGANLASPQNTGTAITFTANGSGGVAPREYKFLVQQGSGAAQVAQTWSTATTYTWTPPTAASYTVTVWARSAGVTVDAPQAQAQLAYTINTPPPAPVTSVTLGANLASPQNTGTAITFTANGSGGVAPREYKFLVQQGSGTAQVAQTWSTATTYTWTPTTAASYAVTVWARSAGVTVDAPQAQSQLAYTINTPPPASVTSVTLGANLASPQNTGTAITFTANGSGGVAPRQYKFLVQQGGGTAQVAQTWSTATTYTWTPPTAASYTVTVWARSAGVTVDAPQAQAQLAFVATTPVPPLTITGLTSNVASPQSTGTAITFTGTVTGGIAPYSYKWWVYDGTTWTMVQDWSSASSYTWTPANAGTGYRVGFWVRSAGVTADTNAVNLSVPFAVTTPAPAPAPTPTPTPTPPPPVPVSMTGLVSNLASPQAVGTAVTFTAAATGGTAPYSYKWWIFDGVNWALARDWSTTATFTWTPTAPGSGYRLGVWVRDSVTTANTSAANASVPFVVTSSVPTPPPAPVPTPTPAPNPVTVTGLIPSVPSPQMVGSTVTFSVSALGGTAPYSYKWWVFNGTSWTLVQDWNTSSTFTWTPTVSGSNYRVGVWARDATTTADTSAANLSIRYVVTTPTTNPTITGLTSDLASPQASGTSVTFTASATGGTAPYSFKWWIFNGTTWTMVRDWSTTTTFTWTPAIPGKRYRVGIWARNAGSTSDSSAVNLSVPFEVTALRATDITVSSTVLRTGVAVTFTASATGGTSPYQYKWWIWDGTVWTMVQDWGGSTLAWTPPAAGSYRIGVWVRDALTSADVGTANLSIPVAVAP